MRAPASSFKNALQAYLQYLVSENKDSSQLRLSLKVIDRWQAHAATETIWNGLKGRLPSEALPTAEEFIFLVLQRRLLHEQVKRVNDETPIVERAVRARAEQYWKAKQGKQYELAAIVRSKLDDFREQRERLLGRKKQEAPRKLFMVGWSDKFKELCGDPLDEIVRVLTEIAFGQEVTIDSVRGAKKPTTRRDRDIRPPK
jgi:hypothetical protein